MKKINTFLLYVLIASSSISFAQNYALEKVNIQASDNVGIITFNNHVNGYFIFYRLKGNPLKKKRSYVLHILDKNLNQINSDTIQSSYNINFLGGIYNGESTMFKLYDQKKRAMNYLNYNTQGQLIKKSSLPVSNFLYFENMLVVDNQFQLNSSLVPIENKGFVSYNKVHFRKQGYTIQYIPNNIEASSSWEFVSNKKSKTQLKADYLYSDEKLLFNFISESKNLKEKDLKYYVQCLDINTGKEISKIDLNKDQSRIIITDTFFEDENNYITIYGEYYENSDIALKKQSLGLITITFDLKGNIINSKKIFWPTEIEKPSGKTSKDKIKHTRYTYLHKFFKSSDGNIYCIGEEFGLGTDYLNKVVNAVVSSPIAFLYPEKNFVLDDISIYKFNSKFELLDVKIIDKSQNVVSFDDRNVTPQQWARKVKANEKFDYAYTSINESGNSFIINYFDFPNRKTNTSFNSCIIKNDTLKIDKFLMNPNNSNASYKVFPAKEGYFMFCEYIKNNLFIKLQKNNFE